VADLHYIASDYPELIDKIVVVDALLVCRFERSFFKSQDDCSPMLNQIGAMSEDEFLQMQKRNMVC
jgi:hypothetical protein